MKAIYQVAERFPTEEKYELSLQIRRAAGSIASSIFLAGYEYSPHPAHGQARSGSREFLQFPSLAEVETQLLRQAMGSDLSIKCSYLRSEAARQIWPCDALAR